MSIPLVTVAQVDKALRLNLEADIGDPSEGVEGDTSRLDDVTLKIGQATDIVIDYLKAEDHTWTVDDVPGYVSAGIILVIQALYDNDPTALSGLDGRGPAGPVVNVLFRKRDPTLA